MTIGWELTEISAKIIHQLILIPLWSLCWQWKEFLLYLEVIQLSPCIMITFYVMILLCLCEDGANFTVSKIQKNHAVSDPFMGVGA